MKTLSKIVLPTVLSLFAAGSAWAHGDADREPASYPDTVKEALQGWPDETDTAANRLIIEYDQPHEISTSQFVWHDTHPWKRTTLYRDPIPHNFPMPHHDYIEQTIDNRTPPEKFDELALYDGRS